jgi:tetratricopeptide (TPR) repeat protein
MEIPFLDLPKRRTHLVLEPIGTMSHDDKSMEDATAAMELSGPTTEDEEIAAPLEEPKDKDDTDDDDEDFMDDDDDDDSLDEKDNASTPEASSDAAETSQDALLCKAVGLKEEGNQQFQKGDLDQAARAYRRGVNALNKIKGSSSNDEQTKALKVTLYTNWSTVTYKAQKYRVSLEMAGKAVAIDGNNVKALYRRAMAHRQVGNLELARTDLRNALAVEPNNAACRKELMVIKKELEDVTARQKKSLAKAFDSNGKRGSFLYDDKEELAKRREAEEKRKQREQEELKQKRKKEWEDECVHLMAKNEPVLSFEEWEKQRNEKEEEEKKKKEQQRKAERKARKERMSATKSDADEDDDDVDFTEAELAAMRGYKKTADGRITSYFTRELSQDEKQQLGDTAPKLLGVNPTPSGGSEGSILASSSLPSMQQLSDVSSSSPTTNSTSAAAASVWNQAGTWEEKNTTDWCQAQLRQRLLEAKVSTALLDAKISKVEDISGDASVVVVSGKKRYIFDLHVKLKYKIKSRKNDDGEETKEICKGVMRLPDICSTHHDEVEIICDGYEKSPPPQYRNDASAVRSMLEDRVRQQVSCFVQDFNNMY